MALVAVLWVVLLLSVMATAVATQSVEGRRAAARSAEAARLDAAADSAIRQVIVLLLANLRTPELPQPIPGTIKVGPIDVQVRVEREASRLDLNAGDEELMVARLREAGLEQEAARALSNRIRDWQDADDSPREGSVERDGYEVARSTHRPRNGPMESVEEVLLVAGAPDASTGFLEGLTVYSHLAEPQRAEGVARITAGEIVRISSCAVIVGVERCRESVVRLTGSMMEPIQVFLWRERLRGS